MVVMVVIPQVMVLISESVVLKIKQRSSQKGHFKA